MMPIVCLLILCHDFSGIISKHRTLYAIHCTVSITNSSHVFIYITGVHLYQLLCYRQQRGPSTQVPSSACALCTPYRCYKPVDINLSTLVTFSTMSN
ncbi:hypothetical protein V8C37DRAFT_388954 [Trichoderma ceciliae]